MGVVGELPERLRPTALEVACGLALGVDPHADRLPRHPTARPRAAVEDAVRRALTVPPCLVSFSGGRDSSAVLATAVAVARREGLSLPIPATYRFPGAAASDESAWQEQVVRHLGLPDWARLTLTSELDSVGPVAQAVLRRHGPLWPFNAHFHVPLLELATTGSLLTGVGGDELLADQRWASARTFLGGRRLPRYISARNVAVAVSPRPVRSWALERRHGIPSPWLRAEAERTVNRERAAFQARSPIAWSGGLAWWWGSRYRTAVSASLGVLADDAGTRVVHPFLDPSVVGAVARYFGRRGPQNRSAAMRAFFGDVLPEALLARRSKAHFDEAFFSEHSRAFAAGWDGTGIDASIVDPDRLADAWRTKHPNPRSFLLMQETWLSGVDSIRR